MPHEPKPQPEYRQVTYRVLFDSPAMARRLAAVAGACRFVWNRMLDRQQQLLEDARLKRRDAAGTHLLRTGRGFTRLRRDTPWLQEMPCAPVRYVLKYQADAWQRFLEGKAGHPHFKWRGKDSVTIPQDVRIRNGRLHFPRLGWLTVRRRGGNPYPDGVAKKAVLRREGGRWMATVCYEIAAPVHMDNGCAIGVDMNTRQVAVSDGQQAGLLPAPDTRRLEARKRRHQRRLARHKRGSKRRARTRARLRRTERRIATVRRNWHHHVSRGLANAAGIIVVEDLETVGMTRSAKGTAEEPGRNVKGKGGAEPGDPRNRLGEPAPDAGVQGTPGHRGRSPAHQPDLCGLRACRCPLTACPGIRVRGLRPRGSRGPERGPQHPASGTGAAARRGAFGSADSREP